MSVFVDSTTLIYTMDSRDQTKQIRSIEWLKALRDSKALVLNLQVLNETFAVVWRKSSFADARSDVRAVFREHLSWCGEVTTPDTTFAAWALLDRYRIQFYDALLLASANAAGCDYFLSEDLNDGQAYGGVTVVNPFRHSPQDVLGRALP